MVKHKILACLFILSTTFNAEQQQFFSPTFSQFFSTPLNLVKIISRIACLIGKNKRRGCTNGHATEFINIYNLFVREAKLLVSRSFTAKVYCIWYIAVIIDRVIKILRVQRVNLLYPSSFNLSRLCVFDNFSLRFGGNISDTI